MHAEMYEGIFKAAMQWPSIDLSPLESVTSLQKAKVLPCSKHLRTQLEDAALNPRMGFNQGTGTISITVDLPSTPPPQNGDSDHNLRQFATWAMLGVLPDQVKCEEEYRNYTENAGADPELLANTCLRVWSEKTGTCFIERKVDMERRSMVLLVRPKEECTEPSRASFSSKTAKYKPVQFGPMYAHMNGRDESGAWSQELMQKQVAEVAKTMTAEFWEHATSMRYIADASLREALTPGLHAFFSSGLQGQLRRFAPQDGFAAFLQGPPGIGKSEFVKVLAASLEHVIRRYADPRHCVAVVKIPLNATPPSSLKQQAYVKGLSDHSVERMMEQNICIGSTVILHLEENPEDMTAQEMLAEIIGGCVSKLLARYPAQAANLIRVCTSNHTLADGLAKNFTTRVVMKPPDEASRRLWAEQSMKLEIESAFPGLTVEVTMKDFPQAPDMRQVHQFWISIAFQAIRMARRAEKVEGQAAFTVERSSEGSWILSMPDTHQSIELVADEARGSLFCYGKGNVPSTPVAEVINGDTLAQMNTLVDMLEDRFLKPAVVVLRVAKEECDGYVAGMLQLLNRHFPEKVASKEIRILSEADSVEVFGSPSDVRGGIFAFIDDITNPNSRSTEEYAVVVARVNEVGQFVLRELLEQGEKSKNHRLAIHKAGCLFLVVLEEGADLTPQLHSRSHLVIP